MIVVIDNYDSFTFNLVQYFFMIGKEVAVFRNDAVTVKQLEAMQPEGIVISPGPGRPSDAGISMEVIRQFAGKFPILGVCLGHQAIGEVFGGNVVLAKTMMHGKASTITHNGSSPLFKDIPSEFSAIRYHSLVVDENSLPDVLRVTAVTDDGTIMALDHNSLPVYGVQFHPESVLTEFGMEMLKNFIKVTRKPASGHSNTVRGGVA